MAASITNVTTYSLHGVEGQAFNHVLVETFTVKDAGKTALHFSGGFLSDSEPYVETQTIVVQSARKGRYDVYLSGTCVAVPPVSVPSQLPPWLADIKIEVSSPGKWKMPAIEQFSSVTVDIADVPLSQVGSPTTIHAMVGVDTGMVNLAAFADPNSLVNFSNTKYQVTIDWGDNQTTTFIGKQQTGVGYVSGSADDWEVLSHQMHASPGTKQIVIKVVDDPPAVGGAGKETITLDSQAIVTGPRPTLVMGGTYTDVDYTGSPPPGPQGQWVIAQFNTLSTVPYTAYTFSINWGDGPSTPATFYNPLPGSNFAAILDNHIYATGAPVGSNTPEYYTITITVTGPGISSAKPLVGTIMEPVYQSP